MNPSGSDEPIRLPLPDASNSPVLVPLAQPRTIPYTAAGTVQTHEGARWGRNRLA